MRDYIIAYPVIRITMKGPNGIDIQALRRTAIAIVLHSGNTLEDAVFCIAEAVCNPRDNFNKSTGKTIAVNRAKHEHNDGCLLFSAEEALTMVQYDEGAKDKEGETVMESTVLSPVSNTPVPYGLLNRLKMLLPMETQVVPL